MCGHFEEKTTNLKCDSGLVRVEWGALVHEVIGSILTVNKFENMLVINI